MVFAVEFVPNFLLSPLANSAGIHQQDVSLLGIISHVIPCCVKDRLDDLGVSYVHLAAVGFNKV